MAIWEGGIDVDMKGNATEMVGEIADISAHACTQCECIIALADSVLRTGDERVRGAYGEALLGGISTLQLLVLEMSRLAQEYGGGQPEGGAADDA